MNTALPRTLVRLAPTVAAGVGGIAIGWVLGFNSGSTSANPFPTFDLRAPTTGASYDIRANQAPGSYQLDPDAPLGSLTRFRGPLRSGRSECTVRDAARTWEERTTMDADGVVRVRELTVQTYPARMEIVFDERGIVREFRAIQLVPIDDSGGGFAEVQIGYRSVRNAVGFEDAAQSGYYDQGKLQR